MANDMKNMIVFEQYVPPSQKICHGGTRNEVLNIYKAARKKKGMIKSVAAQLLHVDESTLSRYESGRSTPQNGTVKTMVEIYDLPILAVQHLNAIQDPLFSYIIPKIEQKQFSSAVLSFVLKWMTITDTHIESLMKIATDDQLTDDTMPQYCCIMDSFQEIEQSMLEVRFSDKTGGIV